MTNLANSYIETSQEDYELTLFDRLNVIKDIVNKWGEENFFISYSGGKDSTVLSALFDEALPGNQIPRVYFNTGIEYRLLVDYVKKQQEKDKRIKIINSGVNLKQLWETKGYPFKSKRHSKLVGSYQQDGIKPYIQRYIDGVKADGTRAVAYACPESLKYQFTDAFKLKVSAHCCDVLKKDISHKYEQESGRHIVVRGVRTAEQGVRALHTDCALYDKDMNLRAFNAINPCTNEFIDWYIYTRDIELCELYYPPYNLKRTGCKGCPYAVEIQHELDMMKEYLPTEYEQCERLWEPVYNEYRRINYRLRRVDQERLF